MKFFVKWFLRLIPFAYMILIWTLSSMPDNAVVELPDSTVDSVVKESLHLVEFAILYLLLVGAILTTGRFSFQLSLICGVIAASYGLLDEIHQSFVPARSATLIDFVKDVTGVVVASYFVMRAYRKHGFERFMGYLR